MATCLTCISLKQGRQWQVQACRAGRECPRPQPELLVRHPALWVEVEAGVTEGKSGLVTPGVSPRKPNLLRRGRETLHPNYRGPS